MGSHEREAARVLYVDGRCSLCRKTGRYVQALDHLNKIEVRSYRLDDSYIGYGLKLSDLGHEVHLVVGQKVFRGFGALSQLLLRQRFHGKTALAWSTFPLTTVSAPPQA